MCLHITPSNKVKVAKKDIIVYKHVIKTCKSWFASPYQYERYELGTVNEVPSFGAGFYSKTGKYLTKSFVAKIPKGTKFINEGLHAYTSLTKPRSYRFQWTNEFLLKCIIPKGTRYIQSPANEEIVALRLKPVSVVDGY